MKISMSVFRGVLFSGCALATLCVAMPAAARVTDDHDQQAATPPSPTDSPAASTSGTMQDATPASAQASSVSPGTDASSAGVQDIVVTAERRTSSTQKTAGAISAVSGADLTSRGANNLSAITSLVPSLHVNNFATGVQIGIRGVYSQSPSPSADPAVAFNVDGVYQARPGSAAGIFYDIARVEVLRGPQGTLYGRNATGGSINVITNRPVDHYEASIEAGYGNYNQVSLTGVLNAPLTDTLYIRAAGNLLQHDGYARNAPAKDSNDEDTKSGRLQLLWQPSSALNVRLTGNYTRQGGVGTGSEPLTDYLHRPQDWTFPLNTSSDRNIKSWAVTGEVNYDLGPATLTYIGAYSNLDYRFLYDNDSTAIADKEFDTVQKEYEITNEIRIASNPGHGPIQYVAGLYQYYEHAPFFQTQLNTPSPGNTLTMQAPLVNATAYAGYGQATWSITPRFRVTGGARLTYDRKEQEAAFSINDTPITNNSGKDHWTSFDWKAGAEYDVTPRNMVYGNVSTSYQAGGINQSIPATTYDPEHLTAYILGSKNRFFDNKLQANIEAFYYDYKDFQGALSLSVDLPQGRAIYNTVANAGKARIYGAELELMAKPDRLDQIDFSLSLMNTKFLNYVAGTTDFTGNRLAKAPFNSFTFGYQHIFELRSGKITARGEFHFEDDQYMSPTNADTSFQPAFHDSNAFIRYDTANGRYFLNLWIRNIENEEHLTHVSLGAYVNDPRTFGATIGAHL